jgi:hypothetical protein
MPFGFRFDKKMQVPDWAPFFTREQFEKFVKLLGDYFKGAKSKIKFADPNTPRISVSGGTFPAGIMAS